MLRKLHLKGSEHVDIGHFYLCVDYYGTSALLFRLNKILIKTGSVIAQNKLICPSSGRLNDATESGLKSRL